MLPNDRTELIEELNATCERYVRKKLALGGYSGWQEPVVRHWLAEQAATRQEADAKAQKWWLRGRVLATVFFGLAAAVWHYATGA